MFPTLFRRVFFPGILALTMCNTRLCADTAVLTPANDVYITSYGGGEGGNPFMKFDISGLGYVRVDSAFLSVRVWFKDSLWDSDLKVWNVHNQTWNDTMADSVLWLSDTSDRVTQLLGFATDSGWARTWDIGAALQRDAVLQDRYATLKLKDLDDPTTMPSLSAKPINSAETLKVGNLFRDLIYFYPSEHDSAPYLTVHYTPLPPVAGSGVCLEFDGTDDYVNIPHVSGGMNFGKSSFTIEAWIKNQNTPGSVWKRIVTKRDAGGGTQWWSLALLNDSLTLEVNGGTRFTAGPAIQGDGRWHYVAASRDSAAAGAVTLCVDGVFYAAGGSAVNTGNNHAIEIGRWETEAYDGETFRGQIDEVRLWKTARSQAQLLANMYAPLAGTESKLTACYRLDEAVSTIARDISSNQYHGTLMNGPVRTGSAAWQARSINEDETLTVATAYDPDNDSLALSVITAPVLGTLTLQNGTAPQAVYVPFADHNGKDSFAVAATDPSGLADTQVVTLTILKVNDPPIADAGQALKFSAAVQCIDIGQPDVTSTNWTAEFWVQRVDCPSTAATLLDGPSYSLRLEQFPNTNRVGFTWYGVYDYSFNYTAPENQWVHLAFVNTSDGVALYVNGDSTDFIGIPIYCPLEIFGNPGGGGFTMLGGLDEVRVWNTARTGRELKDNLSRPLKGNEANLLLYYRLDEMSGTLVNDATGNDHDGTLTNGPGRVASAAWQKRRIDEDDTLVASAGYDPEGDSVTLSAITAPALGSLTLRHGTAPEVVYVPFANRNGTDSFMVAATDPSGLADTALVIATIAPVNDAPIITSAGIDTAVEKLLYRYVVTVGEPADETPATVTILNYPGWCAASAETLFGTVPVGAHGDTSFMVIADDGEFADTLVVQLAVQDSDGYVPVTLSSFTARALAGGIMLNWNTQSEQHNLGFNVLRGESINGDFLQVNAALIPGAGTTSLPQSYFFSDTDATAGTWYYQLEQVDASGTRTYSAVIAATVPSTPVPHSTPPNAVYHLTPQTVLYDLYGTRVPRAAARPGIYFVEQDGVWIKVLVTE